MNQPDNQSESQFNATLAELDSSGKHFAEKAGGYPRALLRTKPNDVAFSATEIVYHLIAVEELWSRRIAGLIQKNESQFVSLNPDELAKIEAHNSLDFDEGVQRFQNARQVTLATAKNLTAKERQLRGNHPKYGPMTIMEIYKLMARHDANHADQFSRTLNQVASSSMVDDEASL